MAGKHPPPSAAFENLVCKSISDFTGKKRSPYSMTRHSVLELIPVLGSQPAGDTSHKPGVRLPLLSARLAVTLGLD